ncbi:MAG TPA: cation diffusion facilitator family transporter [Roseiflexaceae bacterium]|nr:cation diffusion facilitator family transporter [Roseiflexaceae bacterium]
MIQDSPQLTRFAWLSIAAALGTISLIAGAYLLTGSVGLLSDALESVVNLLAAVVALWALSIAARPPDDDHEYGHDKVEYLSSGVEGTLILVAAFSIVASAVPRLFAPQPLEQTGLGIAISVIASLINLAVGRVLLRAGRQYGSITLEADARHLLTDVWTSAGVLISLGLVIVTGWTILDPIIALVVAANIIWAGVQLVRRSTAGLLDTALPNMERATIQHVLTRFRREGVEFHAFRTRQSGSRRFVSFHVLVPDAWTVRRGHDMLERIEAEIRQIFPGIHVFTHLEPLHDPSSFQDTMLDRVEETVP